MLSAASTVNQLCRPPKKYFLHYTNLPRKSHLFRKSTVAFDWNSGSAGASVAHPSWQAAGMHQTINLEVWVLGGRKAHHTLTATVTSLQTLCSCTHPYLPCLHLASLSMLSFSSISHCNRSWQRKSCFRTLLAGTQLLPADNGEQEEKRRRRRQYATEAELTWILGVWVLIQK